MERDGIPKDEWEKVVHFNSHAHVERDYLFHNMNSLHTYFNSHAHVERDYAQKLHIGYITDFNSHAHVERDLIKQIKALHCSISTHTLTWSVTKLLSY